MAENLRREEQVVRYVGGSNYNPTTGLVDASAFARRQKIDDDGLSFTRRHVFSRDENTDQDEIRRVFASHLTPGSTSQFAQIEVGAALDSLSTFDEVFDFVEDQIEADGDKLANPAHALLLGLPFEGEAIGSLKSEVAGDLLARCVNKVLKAKMTPPRADQAT